MYNAGKIILGIIVFAILFSSPLWINVFSEDPTDVPDLQYPADEEECIRDTEYMRNYHMDILNDWRDRVVRDDIRYTEINGVKYEMSLSKTCMSCHAEKTEFCDKCHDYLGVDPYCWDCHVAPEEHSIKVEQFEEKIYDQRKEHHETDIEKEEDETEEKAKGGETQEADVPEGKEEQS